MKRLGEVSPDGVIRMRDGSQFRGALPIELMAAATQPHEALGYLALLRRFVAELEAEPAQGSALKGLVAPELDAKRFTELLDRAEQAEDRCNPSGGAPDPPSA
jgi:hypothetical protein